jgi:CubicO group peptidase (beta-lactamase class C family)
MTDMPAAIARLPAATKDRIDALLAPYDGATIPGASVIVLRGSDPIYLRAFGSADIEAHTPATVHTDYRLASLTKAFTAMSIMLLVRDG